MEAAVYSLAPATLCYIAAVIGLNCWNRHNMLVRAAIYGKKNKSISDRLVPAAVMGLEWSRLVVLLLSIGYGLEIGNVFPAYRWHAVGILVGVSFLCFSYQTFLSVPVGIAWAIFKSMFSTR